jgi:hypothetical protein
LPDNLPEELIQKAESLFVQGKTVAEVAKILKITDTGALYERLRADSNLIRQRSVHFEVDIELLKYKVIMALTGALDDKSANTRIMAARTLLEYMMPRHEKHEGMVVINFGMEPPRMPDGPVYVYEDKQGAVTNE